MKRISLLLLLALFLFSCESSSYDETEDLTIEEKFRFYSYKTIEDDTDLATRGVLVSSKKWITGQTIKIRFLNGENILQEKVKEFSKIWMQYANLEFEFVDSGYADVKIGFIWNNDWVNWSYIGTDSKVDSPLNKPNMPSMNLAWTIDDINDPEFEASVLQQFGLMLGLSYEHKHPYANIPWKTTQVKQYFMQQGWNIENIDNLIFNMYLPTESMYSEFDESSIMVYSVPAKLTSNGYGVDINLSLSETDKRFIAEVYPTLEKQYKNGYEHNLQEPDWEKLKTINNVIGGTRDIKGNYYFYPYNSGNIIKYDQSLSAQQIIGRANSIFRIGPRIIPASNGEIIVRRGYNAPIGYLNLDRVSSEQSQVTTTRTAYGSLVYDYERGLIYHNTTVLDKNFNKVGDFLPDNGTGYGGILYWGSKYKWAAITYQNADDGLSEDVTFFAYQHSSNDKLYSEGDLVAKVTIPNFKIRNGGFPTIYEYNDKLVVINFGGTGLPYGSDNGSILILDPSGKIDAKKYKIYSHADAKWRQSSTVNHLCGGFYWRNKMMVYDEGYNKYYFEFPELAE